MEGLGRLRQGGRWWGDKALAKTAGIGCLKPPTDPETGDEGIEVHIDCVD